MSQKGQGNRAYVDRRCGQLAAKLRGWTDTLPEHYDHGEEKQA